MTEYADEEALKSHIEKVVQFPAKPERKLIRAAPYVWTDPTTIPLREWVYGRHYIRKFVSGTIGPGGFGKSTHSMVEAVAMASGKPLLGVRVPAPLRVWYWNGEDPMEELQRRIAAICQYYEVTADDLGDRLYLNSGRDCEIVVATESKDGAAIAVPVVDDLRDTITDCALDVFMFDPFVSVHAVSENDNGRIGAVMRTFAEIADATNSSCELVHHTRKARAHSTEVSVDDGRGAAAFIDRVRSARSLTRMNEDEARDFDVSPEERSLYFRVDHGKANLSPPARQAAWRRLVSVGLGNDRDGRQEDKVGVVTTWTPKSLMDGIDAEDVLRVQQAISKGMWRSHSSSADWAGFSVAAVLGLNMGSDGVRHRVEQLLKTWIHNGLFVVADREDKYRKVKPFLEVGRWIEP